MNALLMLGSCVTSTIPVLKRAKLSKMQWRRSFLQLAVNSTIVPETKSFKNFRMLTTFRFE